MKNKGESLTGKWIYEEDYGYGKAKGELLLTQKGNTLDGKIIFSEIVEEEDSFMIQEIIKGEIQENKVYIKATEYDIIHSEYDVDYELDSWLGTLINESLIEGESVDNQGIIGNFSFKKLNK